ncbi:MAG TPA: hypothetical protein GX497_04275 [Bacillus bacterium]|nr:hypothetical protein [Bacillus sp. (in: firmicutes)]
MRFFENNEPEFQGPFNDEHQMNHKQKKHHKRHKHFGHYKHYEQEGHFDHRDHDGHFDHHEHFDFHEDHEHEEHFCQCGHHHHNEHHEHHGYDGQHHHHEHKEKCCEDCICEIVKKIHKAQAEVNHSSCNVSCEKSIQQLLSQSKNCHTANTIPFSLDSDDTFFGKAPVYDKYGNFCVIASPFFRVKKILQNCCAVLELLWPTCNGELFEDTFKHDGTHSFPCCYNFNGFVGTGACLTVDLKCFCSISCHKPMMVREATACQIHDIIKNHRHCK